MLSNYIMTKLIRPVTIVNRQLSIKLLLELFLCAYLFALCIGFVLLQSSQLFNFTTALLGVGLGIAFLISLHCSTGSQFGHVAFLTILAILYIFPRILTYLFMPDSVVFPFGTNIQAEAINSGLGYILIGTVLIFSGIFIAGIIFKRQYSPNEPIRTMDYRVESLLIVIGFVILVELLLSFWLELSPYGKQRTETANTLVQLMRGLFSLEMAVLVILTQFAQKKKRNKALWMLTAFASVSLLALMYTTGSRSGVLRLLLMVIAVLFVVQGNFQVRLSTLLVTAVLIGSIGLLGYKCGTMQRLYAVINHIKATNNPDEIKELMKRASSQVLPHNKLSQVFPNIMSRFGLLDYAILLTTQRPADQNARDKYMSFAYTVKSIANTMPGTPFPEAELSTSRIIPILYRGTREEQVRSSGYFSEFWTVWGLAFVFFGWWGGLIAMFITGLLVQSLYIIIPRFLGPYLSYFKVVFIYSVPGLVYFTMGIDHTVVTIFIIILQAIVMVIILEILKKWHERFKQSSSFSLR